MARFDTLLQNLVRPRTLIKAARLGATRYRRDRDLRLTGVAARPGGQVELVSRLVAAETQLEQTRLISPTTYDIRQHVAVLTALIAEVNVARRPGPQAKASGSEALRVVT